MNVNRSIRIRFPFGRALQPPAWLALTASLAFSGCAPSIEEQDEAARALGATSSALRLRERVVPAKSGGAAFGPGVRRDEIILKLVEGSRVRLSGGRLRFDRARVAAKHAALLRRSGLDATRVQDELNVVDRLLGADPAQRTERLFVRSEADLDDEQETLEAQSGEELADLNLYYVVRVSETRSAKLIEALNASPLVEIAYPVPVPVHAAADIAPITPSYVANQGYLNAAPYGIDARFSWTRPGGDGFLRKFMDVEAAWQYTHEDLNLPFVILGTNSTEQHWKDHGTAVVGVVVGAKNGYGVTGISNAATFGTSSATKGVAVGVNAAVPRVANGDVILIEVEYGGVPSGLTCPSCMACPPLEGSQWEMIPPEYYQAEFDAIKAATTAGKIVVEAAGNGGMNLDSAVYGGKFNPAVRDSGAILVGAGLSSTRQPHCYTNAGARVNVQGWGDNIQTLGYAATVPGAPPAQQDQWYMRDFSGTSGAAPMVVGAVLNVQGRRTSLGQPLLNPSAMRSLLTNTGVPQPTPVTRAIGPRPDLRCALEPAQPTAYAKVSAVRQSSTITVNMARSCDGSLQRRQVGSSGVWTAATPLAGSSNVTPRDAALTLANWGSNRVAAFFIGNDGALKYFYEQADGPWQGPFTISAANIAPPGSRIATGVHPGGQQLDVYIIGNDGAAKAYWSHNQGAFFGPLLISAANAAPPGGAVATGPRGSNQLDVFFVGHDGAIKITSVVGALGAFSALANVSATGLFPPGAPLTTGMQGTNQFDVFGVGWDGAVKAYAAAGSFSFFGPFVLTSTAAAAVGSELAAAVFPANQLNVAYMTAQGGVNWLKVVGTGPWSEALITGPEFAYSSSSLAFASEGTNKLDLFVVAHQGIARSSTTSGAGPWSPFTPM
jgi:serine protease